MNTANYDVEDLKNFLLASIIGVISLTVIGYAGCSILSKLGGTAIKRCQAINLMISLPSGIFIVLFFILIGILVKSFRDSQGARARA